MSLSGGTASAVAGDRILNAYSRENVTFWFADTSWEDEDLYRYLNDLEHYWEITIVRFKDGRTPLEVAETVHMGLDFTEQHRMARPKLEYEAIPGVTVDYPLMWDPVALPPHRVVTEGWGIETPRLYKLGFPHNNCGGRCVRQGIKEWQRLKHTFPDRFAEVADWEQEQRAKGGARANYAITRDRSGGVLKALPLHDIGAVKGEQLPLGVSNEDVIGCFCDY